MKKWKQMLILVLLVSLFCGCGSKNAASEAYDMAAAEAPAAATEDMWETEEAVEESASDAGVVASGTGMENVNASSQKLIKTVHMSMETKAFDELLENVKAQVAELGGYIETSDISGNSYYSENGTRSAWLSLRIPADRLDSFVTSAEGLGNVTSKRESVEDITLQYVDVESHKQALLTEQERLMALLEKAESMEDIIAIESRLSEVRYALQSYESTLRTYDNKVDYSTVSLDIYEVERETRTPEKKSFLQEIQYRLSDNLYDIGQGMRNFAIWLISSLPYLVIWAAGIAAVVLIVKKVFKKKPVWSIRKKDKEDK